MGGIWRFDCYKSECFIPEGWVCPLQPLPPQPLPPQLLHHSLQQVLQALLVLSLHLLVYEGSWSGPVKQCLEFERFSRLGRFTCPLSVLSNNIVKSARCQINKPVTEGRPNIGYLVISGDILHILSLLSNNVSVELIRDHYLCLNLGLVRRRLERVSRCQEQACCKAVRIGWLKRGWLSAVLGWADFGLSCYL